MKHWYIITDIYRQKCEFAAISQTALLLVLIYREIRVKVKLHNFSDYRDAVNGKEVDAIAVSPKGNHLNKPIKIVFK